MFRGAPPEVWAGFLLGRRHEAFAIRTRCKDAPLQQANIFALERLMPGVAIDIMMFKRDACARSALSYLSRGKAAA
jgi:hypothetical protein